MLDSEHTPELLLRDGRGLGHYYVTRGGERGIISFHAEHNTLCGVSVCVQIGMTPPVDLPLTTPGLGERGQVALKRTGDLCTRVHHMLMTRIARGAHMTRHVYFCVVE